MPSIENQTLSKLYYSIGEVADMLQVNASLLRFWEKEFNLVVSKKNKKGNRLFSVKEIEQIKRIYHFVKVEGYTLDGAKKALKQKGNSAVAAPYDQVIQTIQTQPESTIDHRDLIARLEKIKKQLLNLPVHKMEEKPAFAPVAQSAPIPEPEPTLTPTPEPKPVIKKAPEKPKPASDMPTLFDF
ncbi:MAG: MerR family transcriptional regulator [Flavobacteriia bacterium]|jgi:DNA-binding transcriptional MerR regulator|nr:MAG: MerR family transcriptional regulator [Flavobacteriia bacterium]